MPTFQRKPLNPSPILSIVRKHPFLMFGLPFLTLMVGSSFALKGLTRTRYDLQAQKVSTMTIEDELGMAKSRKKVDLREEYYRLSNPTLYNQTHQSDSTPDSDLEAEPSELSQSTSTLPQPPLTIPLDETSPPEQSVNQKRKRKRPTWVPQEELELVRVARPDGAPEWGYVPGQEAPVKGQRKEDRWV